MESICCNLETFYGTHLALKDIFHTAQSILWHQLYNLLPQVISELQTRRQCCRASNIPLEKSPSFPPWQMFIQTLLAYLWWWGAHCFHGSSSNDWQLSSLESFPHLDLKSILLRLLPWICLLLLDKKNVQNTDCHFAFLLLLPLRFLSQGQTASVSSCIFNGKWFSDNSFILVVLSVA